MAFLFISSYEDPGIWEKEFRTHMPDMDFCVWDRTQDEGGITEPATIEFIIAALPPRGVITKDRFPKLKAIFSLWAGVERMLEDETLPTDIPLFRLIDESLSTGMSEYIAAWVLYFHRGFDELAAQQQTRTWQEIPAPDTTHRRVGILGLGALGMHAANMLRGLGFQSVGGYSRTKKTVPGVESFYGPDQLKPFLERTEILVCLLPLTEETNGILNAETLAHLPQGAVIINPGRGRHLLGDNLITALNEGHLRGAVLDVFDREPLPSESPLWAHPKIIITPHIASLTIPKTAARSVSDTIKRFMAGDVAPGLVDRDRGY